jgi:uncharacterized protein DUF6152
MKNLALIVVATAVAVAWTTPALAHHSFAAQYDAQKHVELKGVVTKIEWTNPHARFYIDEKNDKGDVTSWNFEMASPNVLVRNGWKRTSLKIGDQVTVTGYLARMGPPAGPKMAIAESLTRADGTKMFASTATDLSR